LLELTDDIGVRLEYFQELEHATRMLNHPGESLVLQTDFLYMVERVDICIDYLKAHVRTFFSDRVRVLVLLPYISDIIEKPKSTYSDSSNA
jgi:Sec34-like family